MQNSNGENAKKLAFEEARESDRRKFSTDECARETSRERGLRVMRPWQILRMMSGEYRRSSGSMKEDPSCTASASDSWSKVSGEKLNHMRVSRAIGRSSGLLLEMWFSIARYISLMS